MSEPMYLQGDTIALGSTNYGAQDMECGDCGAITEGVETEEEFSHGITTWFAEWTCWKCNEYHSSDGWY